MKNVLFTKYGPIDHDVMLDLAFMKSMRSKTDGEYTQTGIETEEDYAFGNKHVAVFGEMELRMIKSA